MDAPAALEPQYADAVFRLLLVQRMKRGDDVRRVEKLHDWRPIIYSIYRFFPNSRKLLLVPYTKDFRRITRF